MLITDLTPVPSVNKYLLYFMFYDALLPSYSKQRTVLSALHSKYTLPKHLTFDLLLYCVVFTNVTQAALPGRCIHVYQLCGSFTYEITKCCSKLMCNVVMEGSLYI